MEYISINFVCHNKQSQPTRIWNLDGACFTELFWIKYRFIFGTRTFKKLVTCGAYGTPAPQKCLPPTCRKNSHLNWYVPSCWRSWAWRKMAMGGKRKPGWGTGWSNLRWGSAITLPTMKSITTWNTQLHLTAGDTKMVQYRQFGKNGGRDLFYRLLKPKSESEGKGKGKVQPITGHEGPEGSRGIALLFLTLALDGVGWSTPRFGQFTPSN